VWCVEVFAAKERTAEVHSMTCIRLLYLGDNYALGWVQG